MKLAAALISLSALTVAGCAGVPDATPTMGPQVSAVPAPGLQGSSVSGPVAVADAGAADDPRQQVCKKQSPPTGSRLGATTLCMSKAEWDAQQQAARDYTNDVARSAAWNTEKPQ